MKAEKENICDTFLDFDIVHETGQEVASCFVWQTTRISKYMCFQKVDL